MLKTWLFYCSYAVRFIIGRRQPPLVLGLIITDRCNLSCRHCRLASRTGQDMPAGTILEMLRMYHRRGYRDLYLEGGEPFLWRDPAYTLDEIIDEARKIGFFHVHLYTNGLFPLETHADAIWVSIDGLQRSYTAIRGPHFPRVVKHISEARHPRMIIIFTVNQINKSEIEEFLIWVRSSGFRVKGVMFYFHTPYYGIDDLFIDFEERKRIIATLIRCKRQGLPVFNSYAALGALKTGLWKRPISVSLVAGLEGEHVCCRNNEKVTCLHCGYSACAEIVEGQNLKPSALKVLLGFW